MVEYDSANNDLSLYKKMKMNTNSSESLHMTLPQVVNLSGNNPQILRTMDENKNADVMEVVMQQQRR